MEATNNDKFLNISGKLHRRYLFNSGSTRLNVGTKRYKILWKDVSCFGHYILSCSFLFNRVLMTVFFGDYIFVLNFHPVFPGKHFGNYYFSWHSQNVLMF